MRRRDVLHFFGAAMLARGAGAFAQDKKIPRIGMLALSSGELLEPVREGLRALGYIDGKNIRLEERAAGDHYERLAAIADEFVRLPVDMIVSGGTTATSAARRATSTIPIVMIAGTDPVKAGHAASLARPGGNVTGLLYTGIGEIGPKRFELAKELIPRLTRVGVFVNPGSGGASDTRTGAQAGARDLKLELGIFEIPSANHFQQAFEKALRAGVQVLIVPPSSMFNANQKLIIDLAAKFRIPSIYGTTQWVETGGLASYGSDISIARREAARYIDKILRGAKPGDLPIEQLKTVELALNLKTARALGLKIPEVVLLRADKVVE